LHLKNLNKITLTGIFLSIAFLLYIISKFFHIAPNIIPLLLPIFIPLLNSLYYSIIFTVGFLFLNLFIGLHIQALPLIILFFLPLISFFYFKNNLYSIITSIFSITIFLVFFDFLIPEIIIENKIIFILSILSYLIGIHIYNILIIELSAKLKKYMDKHLEG